MGKKNEACPCTPRKLCGVHWAQLSPAEKKSWLRKRGVIGPEHDGPRLTERDAPCPGAHPTRPDLKCVHPDGHVVHFDGGREIWLSPTVADDMAIAEAEARGYAKAVAALGLAEHEHEQRSESW